MFRFVRFFVILVILSFLGTGIFRGMVLNLDEVESPSQSVVLSTDGKTYCALRTAGGMPHDTVAFDDLPDDFVKALLAREDTKFYDHHGVDFMGIARAFVKNVLSMSVKQGGSTLTQQLAKNAYSRQLPKGSFISGLQRKIIEAVVAIRIEERYSKEEILEFYVNRIYFGSGYYGISDAAQGYFRKPVDRLSLGESAALVGVIRGPEINNPYKSEEKVKAARDAVIKRMLDVGVISNKDAENAKFYYYPKSKSGRKREGGNGYVRRLLREELRELVDQKVLTQSVLEQGGLKIKLTLDPALQQRAERDLASHLRALNSKNELQGAIVSIDNRTGAIRALQGGKSFKTSQFCRATMAKRQAASCYKPFVYAAYYERGNTPSFSIADAPFRKGELPRGYDPKNHDGKYLGVRPAEDGLIYSRNPMAVRAGLDAGLKRVADLGVRLELAEKILPDPGICLGITEVELLDLTSAYTIFPNKGLHRKPYLIESIMRDGNVLYQHRARTKQVITNRSAILVSQALEKAMQHGTAKSARRLGWSKPSGGKTGTSSDAQDLRFVGYTSSLTTGVWIGRDNGKPVSDRASGTSHALPLWVNFMKAAPDSKYPAKPLYSAKQKSESETLKAKPMKRFSPFRFFP